MVKEKAAKIRFWYGIFLSIFSAVVGVLFIVQTWSIYTSAPQSPYTVESIKTHFRQIAIPVWLWVAAVVGNILLSHLYPEKKKRPKAYIDMTYALSKAKQRLSGNEDLLSETSKVSKKEEKFRLIVCVACATLIAGIAIVGGLILFGVLYRPLIKTEFFTAHDGVVDKLFQCVLLSIVAMLLACVAARLNLNSRTRERVYYLQEMATNLQNKKTAAPTGTVAQEPKQKKVKSKWMGVWLYRAAIFSVAIVLLIIGVLNGGMREVLLKAINICTQCIGLG